MIPQACIYLYKKESKPPTTLTQADQTVDLILHLWV